MQFQDHYQVIIKKFNQMIRGWIQYFKILSIKGFLEKLGQCLRHKVICIIIKQWKRLMTIYNNLMKLNKACRCNFTHEDIFKCANSRLGWYRRSTGNIVNFRLSPIVLGIEKGDRLGLVNPLIYYLNWFKSQGQISDSSC